MACFSNNAPQRKKQNELPESQLPTGCPLIFPRTLSAQSFTFRCSIPISIAMATATSKGKYSMCISLSFFFFLIGEIVGLAQPEAFKACCWPACRLMSKCISLSHCQVEVSVIKGCCVFFLIASAERQQRVTKQKAPAKAIKTRTC